MLSPRSYRPTLLQIVLISLSESGGLHRALLASMMAAVVSSTVSPFARNEDANLNIVSFRFPSVTFPGASVVVFAVLGLSFRLPCSISP